MTLAPSRIPMTDAERGYLETWRRRQRFAIPLVSVVLLFVAAVVPVLLYLKGLYFGDPLSLFAWIVTLIALSSGAWCWSSYCPS